MINKERYQRQILLRELGKDGQQKLLDARVLVIGAGGLGCPALQYLTAAGVGTIGIVDFDVVEFSNLHRQVLYSVLDIGKPKADVAAKKLKALNPEICIITHHSQLTTHNALKIISGYDIVIDGSDNFSTRYFVNDACVILSKPLVYGAVLKFEGQIGVFNLADKVSGIKTNYRDLFPKPPAADETLSCNEAGVLGVVPGIIGTMQATEAIKIITGIGDVLSNQIVSYNVLSNSFYKFSISPTTESESLIPKSEADFLNFNYDWFCGIHQSANEITIEAFNNLILKGNIRIIDVRELSELPVVDEFNCERIPMSKFEQSILSSKATGTVVVFCQTGMRSKKAVEILNDKFPELKSFSLAGGMVAWKKHHHKIIA